VVGEDIGGRGGGGVFFGLWGGGTWGVFYVGGGGLGGRSGLVGVGCLGWGGVWGGVFFGEFRFGAFWVWWVVCGSERLGGWGGGGTLGCWGSFFEGGGFFLVF